MGFVSPLRKLKQLLPTNSFARGIVVLAGGTAGAQAIMVAASPLLTRLYTPTDFGGLAVYSGVLTLLLILACFRYEMAIPLPADDDQAVSIVALAIGASISASLIIAVALIGWGDAIVRLFNLSAVRSFLWLLPLGILAGGIYRAFYYYAVRHKTFALVSSTRVYQVGVQIFVQIAGAPFGVLALVVGMIAGQGAGAPRLGRLAMQKGNWRRVSFVSVWQAAWEQRRFPMFDAWSGLLNSLSHQLPPLFMASKFGAAQAGFYLLAMRILLLPFDMIASAIGTSIHASGRQQLEDGTLGNTCRQMVILCLDISLPALLVAFAVSPTIFPWLFGNDWREAAYVVQALVPLVVLRFCGSPVSVVGFILQKQALVFAWQAIYCAIVFSALYVGSIWGFISAVWWYAVAGSLWYLILLIAVLAMVGVKLPRVTLDFARHLGVVSIILAPLFVAAWVEMPLWTAGILVTVTFGGLVLHYWRVLRRFWGLKGI